MVALGGLVFCGVGGAALWLGVAASGGLAAVGDSWEQVSSCLEEAASYMLVVLGAISPVSGFSLTHIS